MKTLKTFTLAVALFFSATPTWAHHSFAAEFDVNKPVTVKGTLTKLDWINPHSWIYVDVTAANGSIEHWQFEAGAPNQLLRRGVRRTDFPLGVQVIVTGYAHKREPFIGNASSVTKLDGTKYFLGGSSPDAPGATK